MVKLPMATFRANLEPTISFKHRDQLLHLHREQFTMLLPEAHNAATPKNLSLLD